MSSQDPLLEVNNLHKHFGSIRALDGMDIRVNRSEIMGLVGDNGAGKSTLIKCLVGYHQPDETLDQGGLAGAVVADQAHDLTVVDADVHAVQCADRAEVFVQVLDFK